MVGPNPHAARVYSWSRPPRRSFRRIQSERVVARVNFRGAVQVVGCDEGQGALRSVAVVVLDVLVQDGFEMTASEDEHPVQAFSSKGPDETFGEGVRLGRLDRRLDDRDPFGCENLDEGAAKLGISVTDEESST